MKMKRIAHLTAGTVLLVAGSLSAQAATVTFSDFNDSHSANVVDARELFYIPGNVINGNALDIGLQNFKADGNVGGANIVALDTLSFKITAMPGQYITKIEYSESGTKSAGVGGITVAAGSVVANGEANDLGLVLQLSPTSGTGWSLTTTHMFDAALGITEVVMTITNSLFAVGDASILKNAASVAVTTVPLPPALGLLGAALIGLTTIGKRRNRAA